MHYASQFPLLRKDNPGLCHGSVLHCLQQYDEFVYGPLASERTPCCAAAGDNSKNKVINLFCEEPQPTCQEHTGSAL
ncbi:hypothetical protein Y1Q_0020037 [Alligator mississippiensis]|uniref:Uncharacterized protein n=1 Tax=Alligator mississippiensis TaxID=8496 RepID=A0A151LYU7_ALLMI|nr:hypothetical protein Y1Q_0020037 [Alligator mississippiensis]